VAGNVGWIWESGGIILPASGPVASGLPRPIWA
jgi:hypothetical protein